MVSTIDLAISIGMFIIFVVLILISSVNYFTNYRTQAALSEYRGEAYSIYSLLFSTKGVPSNWEDLNVTPVLPGLMTDLYRIPFGVHENNNTPRQNTTIGMNITFDSACTGKAWNNTVILYNTSNSTMAFGLQNQNFCSPQFLKSATIVFNDTFAPGETRYYYLYYSADKNTTVTSYGFPSAYATNMTAIVYPEDKLKAISIAKLLAMRRLDYSTLQSTLGDYAFYIQVGGIGVAFPAAPSQGILS